MRCVYVYLFVAGGIFEADKQDTLGEIITLHWFIKHYSSMFNVASIVLTWIMLCDIILLGGTSLIPAC